MLSLKQKIQAFIKDRTSKISLKLKQGYLETKSPEFDRLFPPKTKIKRVASGFEFTEGPVWFSERNYLLFSDIPANKIYRLKKNGKFKIYQKPSNKSNGLTRDNQGRLIICEHQTRRVSIVKKDASIVILVDQFEGKKLNSPNDVVVRSDGLIYFTDPPYGIKPEEQEQPVNGVYCYHPQTKELVLVADDFDRPNGLAFSVDEKKLYIDDSTRHHVRVFDVNDDGTLTNSRIFHDLKIDRPGCPDGMVVDIEDNLYCTAAGGIWVLDSDGNHLGTIVTPEIAANCAWGDEDDKTLYITARTSIYKIRVNLDKNK